MRTLAEERQTRTELVWQTAPVTHAQVIVGKGRRGAKVQLPERFEQAIDRAGAKSGNKGWDAARSAVEALRRQPPRCYVIKQGKILSETRTETTWRI